jgi:CDP-paratose 2-epimerase
MNYKNILVTGGAGFVGSNIATRLKEYFPRTTVTALDNLSRKGSELTLPRLQEHGVVFRHGDVRKREDLALDDIDLIIECSAEPSVMAGVTSSPEYLIHTNLLGAINCFELARTSGADVVFLSTSRVYPVGLLNNLSYHETATRFELDQKQKIPGASNNGISEEFPMSGARTLYGATKLSAELILNEYVENYHINAIVDRFGVIAGPWQMGKVDQGFIALWIAHHVFGKPLSYIGFGGIGKQVRDVIHVDDVFDLLIKQLDSIEEHSGKMYNIGGGRQRSISLVELTTLCEKITGKSIRMSHVKETRPGDVRIYISDNTKFVKASGWKPKRSLETIITDVTRWIRDNASILERVIE